MATVQQPFILYETFTVNAAPSGTTLTVGQIPAGMQVLGVEVYNTALGASVTLAAGVTGNTTLYIAASAAASAGKLSMTDTIAGGVGNVSNTAARNLIITTGGATTAATNQTVTVKATLIPYYV
jgi:hypothetical protein